MKRKTLVNNHKELKAISSRLREQVSETEKNFVKDYETISRFVGLSGVYKNQKHKETKKDIHSLVVKFVSDILEDVQIFGEKHRKLNNLVVPSITLGVSLLLINIVQGKRKKSSLKHQPSNPED